MDKNIKIKPIDFTNVKYSLFDNIINDDITGIITDIDFKKICTVDNNDLIISFVPVYTISVVNDGTYKVTEEELESIINNIGKE